MNKYILTFVCCLTFSLLGVAQTREIIPVDWKGIKKEIKKNPEHVRDLVKRLSAEKLDTTMTYPERILAFYGQSFLTDDGEELDARESMKLLREEKYKDCIKRADKALDVNPLNLDALCAKGVALKRLSKDSKSGVAEDECIQYFNRMTRIFNTIAMTGYGDKEHPFYVTKVSDEYSFMNHYLELYDRERQVLAGNCDLIYLKNGSKYYDAKEIYFEITRVLELESIKFGLMKPDYK